MTHKHTMSSQIPIYNGSDPALWFYNVRSTFALSMPKPIMESFTKCNYLVFNFLPDIASLIHNVLIKSGATDPYTKLKTEIINHSGESSQQKICKLLSREETRTLRINTRYEVSVAPNLLTFPKI